MRKIISIFKRNNRSNIYENKISASFSHLSKEEQNKILKKGAEIFTEKFNKTFEKLARE